MRLILDKDGVVEQESLIPICSRKFLSLCVKLPLWVSKESQLTSKNFFCCFLPSCPSLMSKTVPVTVTGISGAAALPSPEGRPQRKEATMETSCLDKQRLESCRDGRPVAPVAAAAIA